ncbi:MAG: hypothetical protein WC547_04040, partial [Candidatus Omnitrophota bacterium]
MRSIAPHRVLFRHINEYARKNEVELYVVGGFLRDIYLKRSKQCPDIDLCIAKRAIPFGKGLAGHLKCGFVVLDELHGCCRLIVRARSTYTIDISDFRGPTLAADLALRDFSVNTLCLALSDLVRSDDPSASVIDLHGARLDIKNKRLRILYAKAFDDDPLRVLRAFSLSAVFGFVIDRETMAAAGRKKRLLAQVSGERIRDELFKILESCRAYESLCVLDAQGILEVLFPEIRAMKRVRRAGKDRLDVWRHTR